MQKVISASLVATAFAAQHHETGTFSSAEFSELGFAGAAEVRGDLSWLRNAHFCSFI